MDTSNFRAMMPGVGIVDCLGLVLAFSLCSILLTGAALAVYRVRFHPLAKFPGPFLAKISDLHGAYFSTRGESHLKIWRAHQKYGPVVRIGPNKVVFDTVAALHDIYTTKQVKKSVGYSALVTTPGAYNTFNCVDKDIHRRKRKAVSLAFSDQATRAFEPVLLKHVQIFLRKLAETTPTEGGWSTALNMADRCKYLTMDIMGDFGFGRSFELQTSEVNHGLVKSVLNASFIGGLVGQYPRLRALQSIRFFRKGRQSTFARITRAFFDARMQAEDSSAPDLFNFILQSKDPSAGPNISSKELWGEARLFILAGSETTASALAALFFYLSRYPQCLQKATSEVRESFLAASEIRAGPKLAGCSYLRACLDEAMRMSPPVGGALGREVLDEGLVLDGQYVPRGSDVGSSLYCIHHDEDHFPDSFTFKPERWLSGFVGPEQLARQRRAFQPFSLGPRKCVAQNWAYLELSLAVAKCLWYFDMRRPDGDMDLVGAGTEGDRNGRGRVNEFQLYEHFTSTQDGPYLEFRCRGGLEKELSAEAVQ